MHCKITVLIPKEDAQTQEAAIDQAESYADSVVESQTEYDYHQSYADTAEIYDDAEILKTDTSQGISKIEKLKESWQQSQLDAIRNARETFEQYADSQILNGDGNRYAISKISSFSESPLIGERFGHVELLRDFENIGPSWMIPLDFHY